MINYKEILPDNQVSDFIRCFWKSDSLEDDSDYTILPNGYFDLIIEFRENKIDRIKITGIWTVPIDVKTIKDTKLLCVRFKPLAAEYLFKMNFRSLINSSTTLPLNFWNLDNLNSNKFDEFIRYISNHIKFIISNAKNIDERKRNLFDLVFKKNNFTVKYVSEKTFWGSRQINRYFKKQYGFSLKTYLDIIRFNSIYEEIAKDNKGLKAGYFDQPHFIREIKKYTGFTPRQLSKNKNDRFIQLSFLKFG
ncbi:helix-turn-helix domain-containing protein [Pedobacter nototheniae]|uniref:helix-turn-helix domain-containing protein n=1 Tax=Pedobacter nototheniae TaxID=2488994 RepID=UPI00103EB4CE|nr:AraC family transcriptional regulator [Pedobacter nototheniae]